jgi:hypothetical protein
VNGSSGLYAVSVNPTTGRAYVARDKQLRGSDLGSDLEDAMLNTSAEVIIDSRNLST